MRASSDVQPGSEPQIIGRYALYDAIASGGMATVYLGRMLGSVGFARTVAIKRLHPHLAADPGIVAMLVDEARLVSRIRHPNVVPTLDVVAEQGELFLVMEYVQGEALGRLIRSPGTANRRIPPDIVATILVGILHGLHAAHEARSERGDLLGIVHRDVSPQNILVGIDGVPRLVDFGVAKAAGRVGQDTREGQLKGKLAYMAPEQIRGLADRRTDIYAASVVLWEALAGRRLFSGQTDIEVFAKVAEGTTTPPSTYSPGLPAILDQVTLRGLRRDPDERYQTAREMARDLEDATALVAASKIGEWVELAAKAALVDRASRVDWIESDSAARAPVAAEVSSERHFVPTRVSALPSPEPPDGEPAAPADRVYELSSTDLSTELSAVTPQQAPAMVGAPKALQRKHVAAFAIGVSLACLVGVWGYFQERPRAISPSTEAAAADPAAPPPSASAASPPPTAAPVASTTPPTTPPTTTTPSAPGTGTTNTTHVDRGTSRQAVHTGTNATPPGGHPQTVAPPPPLVAPPKAPAKDDVYDHM